MFFKKKIIRVTGNQGGRQQCSVPFMKFGAGILAAAIMLLLGTSVESHAQTGIVHLTVVNAGFIVSTGSGTGTLSYQGKEYRLSVVSVGFGTIGVAGAELAGTAYNLRTAADIAGTYRAVAAGLTVGGGAQAVRFQNANGVILELLGVQLGLEVVLGSAGMTIALQ
jgi:hypothetical protein